MKNKIIIALSAVLIVALISITVMAIKPFGNHIKGEKIVTYGDSITWGQSMPKPPYVGKITWPNTFAKITGANVTNKGYGGTYMSISNSSTDDKAFCNLVDTDNFSYYEAIIIMYGTNDYGKAIELGDDKTLSKSTFKGALRYSLNRLKKSYPKLKITLMTPMYANVSYWKNEKGYTLNDYADAIIEIGYQYNIPVIDLQHGMGINATNFQAMYWDSALHPNEATYKKMGEFIAKVYTADMK